MSARDNLSPTVKVHRWHRSMSSTSQKDNRLVMVKLHCQ